MIIRTARGVTIIELIVGLSITLIVLSLAIPSVMSSLPRIRANGAARAIVSDIQWVRSLSVNENNNNYKILFSSISESYTIYDDKNSNNIIDNNEAVKTVNIDKDYPQIRFGYKAGANNPDNPPSAINDKVTFTGDQIQFSSKGLINESGYVYIIPSTDTTGESMRAVKTTKAGQVKIFSYNPATNSWS